MPGRQGRIISAVSESKRLEINWFGVVGSALGAVSAAVVLSTLGAAGTLVGAALGSLCITVGGAIYSHSLERTKARVATASAQAARRTRVAAGAATRRTTTTATVDDSTATTAAGDDPAVSSEAEPGPAKESWQQVVRGLPWKRIAALAVGLFAVAMAIILVFELSTGRPVSSYTGGTSSSSTGTSVPGISGRGGDQGTTVPEDQDRAPGQEQDQDEAPEQEPAPQPDEGPAPDDAPAPGREPQPDDAPQPGDAPQQEAPPEAPQRQQPPPESQPQPQSAPVQQ